MLRTMKMNLLYWVFNKIDGKVDLKKLEPVPSVLNKIQNFFLKPFIDRNALNRIILGPISFKLLCSGYETGLFQYLAKSPGSTLADISAHLNIETYPADILLNGLDALNLVQKGRRGRYYNTLPSMLLVQDFNNAFLAKLMDYMQHILSPAMTNLQQSITENKPAGLHKIFGTDAKDYYYELSKDDNYNQYFKPFMSAFSLININAVATLPMFSQVKRLLDIGGNVGELAMAVAKHHPSINITVYDHPSTAATATQRFQENNCADRFDAIGGDFLVDAFPAGYDCLLFAHVIDIFCEETNKKLFQKAFESLGHEGKICVFTPIVHGDADNSFTYKVYNAYFLCLANGKGQFYRPDKIVNWIKDAGFTHVEMQYLPCNEVIITGTKI